MHDDIARLAAQATDRIAGVTSDDELRALRSEFFGKQSQYVGWRKSLGALAEDERRAAGAALTALADQLNAALDARGAALASVARQARLEADRLDLTEVPTGSRAGHVHLTTQAMDRLEDLFVGMGFTVAEGPEAETDWYNFESLNLPAGHPARGMWDTLYLDWGGPESTLMRTHTSPVQMRTMEANEPPIWIVAPGRVYRNDTPDASHLSVFHQIEGLVIDEGISFADLAGTIEAFTGGFFGDAIHSRLRPSYFPFTEPSAEFDITCVICKGDGCRTCKQTGWIELGGCGMVHPNVLRNGGIDPERWSGFAFGFGMDRFAQMFHGVDDLRELFTNDVRFVTQF